MSVLLTLDTGEQLDVSAYPLPEGYEELADAKFNREELAKAMRVSTVTISKWVDAGMPVAVQGSNGQSYQFVFSHCYAWRMWDREQQESARKAKAVQASQLSMLFLNDDEASEPQQSLSPKDIRAYAEAEIIRNKAAEQRGELVRSAQMQELVDTILVAFRSGMTGLPDWLEQEFNLSPHQVEKAQKYCDSVLGETKLLIQNACFKPAEVEPIFSRVASKD